MIGDTFQCLDGACSLDKAKRHVVNTLFWTRERMRAYILESTRHRCHRRTCFQQWPQCPAHMTVRKCCCGCHYFRQERYDLSRLSAHASELPMIARLFEFHDIAVNVDMSTLSPIGKYSRNKLSNASDQCNVQPYYGKAFVLIDVWNLFDAIDQFENIAATIRGQAYR
jgi:hypothetical protein